MAAMNEIKVVSLLLPKIIAKNTEFEEKESLSLHKRLDFYIETSTRT